MNILHRKIQIRHGTQAQPLPQTKFTSAINRSCRDTPGVDLLPLLPIDLKQSRVMKQPPDSTGNNHRLQQDIGKILHIGCTAQHPKLHIEQDLRSNGKASIQGGNRFGRLYVLR